MTAAALVRTAHDRFERLVGSLLDPKRGERAMLLLLVGYAAVWTLYASIARSSQDLHPDMTELIAWSRQLEFGYLKHPPLAAWLVRLWFSVTPSVDWSFYLLAMLMPAVALWVFWRLAADYLDIDKRVLGVALLMFVPFYNFHALKFNPNTILMPLWAATTFWFLRSYRTGGRLYSVLTGLGAGACMLGKYWSVFLLAGLAIAALVDPRRSTYLRSSAPWITAAVGLAVFGPHLIWLFQHDFAPFEYAVARHEAHALTQAVAQAGSYLAGSAAYVAAPIILVLLAARPDRTTLADMVWPNDRERRLVVVACFAPLLLPIATALASNIDLTSLWSMSAWTLLPIVMLSPAQVKISPLNLRRILGLALAEPLLMLLAAPAIAIAVFWFGGRSTRDDAQLLAAETERHWHEFTSQPLRFIGCDAAFAVIAYAADRPRSLPIRLFHGDVGDQTYADANHWPSTSPLQAPVSAADLRQSGVALVCSDEAPHWWRGATAWAAKNPASLRIDTEITRTFLGMRGQPHHYVIFIIPPQP